MGSFGESVVGSIPLVGDLFGYGVEHYEANRQMHFQEDEAKKSRQFNSEEADKSRQFQQSLYNQQIAENRSLISEERAYNTPAMQVQRLQEGGINPAVYFGSQGIAKGGQVTGSVPSPSSVPQASSSAMGGTVQIPSLNFGNAFKNVAEGMNLISKTKTENLMRDPLFQKAMEDVLGQKLANKSLDILNYVNEHIKDIKIKREIQALANDVANEGLVNSEKELNEAKSRTEATLQRVNGRLAMKTQTEYLILKNQLGAWKQTYESEMAVRRSEVQKNKAQANEANEAANNQKSMSLLNKFELEVRRNVQGDIEDTYLEELNKLKNENAISQEQLNIAKAIKKIQDTAADHAEALFWKDFFLDIVTQGTNAFTSIRNSKSWENLSDASQRRVDARLKEIENQYGDKVEITTPNSRGGTTRKTYRRPHQKYGSSRD